MVCFFTSFVRYIISQWKWVLLLVLGHFILFGFAIGAMEWFVSSSLSVLATFDAAVAMGVQIAIVYKILVLSIIWICLLVFGDGFVVALARLKFGFGSYRGKSLFLIYCWTVFRISMVVLVVGLVAFLLSQLYPIDSAMMDSAGSDVNTSVGESLLGDWYFIVIGLVLLFWYLLGVSWGFSTVYFRSKEFWVSTVLFLVFLVVLSVAGGYFYFWLFDSGYVVFSLVVVALIVLFFAFGRLYYLFYLSRFTHCLKDARGVL